MAGKAPPTHVRWVLLFPQQAHRHITAPLQCWHGQRSSPALPLNHQCSMHPHFEILALTFVRLPQCTARETQLCWECASGHWRRANLPEVLQSFPFQLLLATRHISELRTAWDNFSPQPHTGTCLNLWWQTANQLHVFSAKGSAVPAERRCMHRS